MCARLGVRVAYAQAYHHQGNGRAETAGHQVMDKIRKLVVDRSVEGVSWVELLPKALRLIHDTPGETGLSPYKILFGRHRGLAGLPYKPDFEVEDAHQYFGRMESQDRWVADRLNQIHAEAAKQANKGRKEPPPLVEGSKVWFRPEPRGGDDKLDVPWKGPAVVVKRVSEQGYVISLKRGVEHEAHRSQLRPHVEDTFSGDPFPLYYFSAKGKPLEAAPDEWEVEKILDHRKTTRGWEFKVQWKGFGPRESRWEPAHHFCPQYNE